MFVSLLTASDYYELPFFGEEERKGGMFHGNNNSIRGRVGNGKRMRKS